MTEADANSPDDACIGIAQWHPLCGMPEHNLETAIGHVDTLARRGAELVVLPELWPCGYDPATLAADAAAAAEPVDGARGDRLSAAASSHRIWLVAGSVPERAGGRLYNTTVVYGPDGDVRATHRKVHLYALLGEDRVFSPGKRPTVLQTYRFGTIGLSICFDGDHPAYARALRDSGARIVVAVSAYEVGAQRWWDVLYPANALVNGQWWVMANQHGGDGESALFGGSQVIAPDGAVVLAGPRGANPGGAASLLTVSVDLRAGIDAADTHNAALWTY